MRKHTVEIRYDLCRKLFDDKVAHRAIITCESHRVDLCDLHLLTHFERWACRLVPSELASSDETTETTSGD